MKLLLGLGLGFLGSGAIGWLAHRRGSLSRSGVVGAVLVGTLIFGLGGWPWGLVLITFFVTSSRLSHFREAAKARVAADKFSKGHQRDLGQALANGGAGALIAVLSALAPGPPALAAFVGAMATVNADTWATELGVLSHRPPRMLLTGRVVEPGTSGAVSGLGLMAALSGAAVIGLAAWGLAALERLAGGASMGSGGAWLVPTALLGGLGGALLDSVLGATVQRIFRCPSCGKETERTIHACGTPTVPTRGWRWLDNDRVNFLSSLGGALIGVWVARALGIA